MKKKNLKETKENLNSWAKYSGLAFQMAGIILLGALGGKRLDQWLNTRKPVFTALLALLGVFGAIYFVIKDLTKK